MLSAYEKICLEHFETSYFFCEKLNEMESLNQTYSNILSFLNATFSQMFYPTSAP